MYTHKDLRRELSLTEFPTCAPLSAMIRERSVFTWRFPRSTRGLPVVLGATKSSGQQMRLQFQDFQVEPEGQDPSLKIKDIIRI